MPRFYALLCAVRPALFSLLLWWCAAPAAHAQGVPPGEGLVADSTELRVLRQFYHATGGPQWTNRANWLVGTTLAEAATWHGVGVGGGDVTVLSLGDNGLAGQLPAALGQLRGVSHLSLYRNQLSGPLPASLADLTALNQVGLSDNRFEGELTGLVDRWTNLQSLDVSRNRFTGPLPAALGALPRLYSVAASDNRFAGPLPAALGRAGTLWGLYLTNNRFTGPIPGAWGRLAALRQLFLGSNQLSGPLPDSLALMADLDYLVADHNQLTGPVPAAYRRFRNLYALNLGHNQLAGALPDSLRAAFLTLGHNRLSGAVPATWSFHQLIVDGNDLTSLPDYNSRLGYPYLEVHVTGNFLDFASYEPNQWEPGVYQFWDYGQRTPGPADTVQAVAGAAAALPGAIGGAHNAYQWQRLVGGAWADLPGDTLATRTVAAVAAYDAGEYRTRVTNRWVPGITLYSRSQYLDAVPYLAKDRNLPVDANRVTALTTPLPAADQHASAPADVNFVRTWVPRVPLTDGADAPAPGPAPGPGRLVRELWTGIPGTAVADIPVTTPPTSVSYVTALESPLDLGDDYGTRLRGYLRAPQTGAYTFWVAGDDQCELWLSPDEDPAHKVRLAHAPVYTGARNWMASPEQQSAPVALVAGRRYYVEVLHKEGYGPDDNVAVAWRAPDGVFEGPIAGAHLFPVPTPGVTPATPPPPAPAPARSPQTAGFLLREQWDGVAGDAVAAIPVTTPPTHVGYVPAFEAPGGAIEKYGARLRGYVQAPQTGAYTFWVAGDDNCEFWLSSDENPANKVRLAHVPAWTGPREWDRFPEQESAPVALVAGRRYYVEVLHKEGVGGDHVAVAWRTPDGAFEGPIAGARLYPARPGQAPGVAPWADPADGPAAAPGGPAWTVDQARVTTEYLDGLGRPLQTVQHGASPGRRDLVQPRAYDALGREPRQFLPYAAPDTAGYAPGAYRYRALAEQQAFYRRTGPVGGGAGPLAQDDPTRGVARTGAAFAETLFEASPLNRVAAQGAAGEAWRLTAGHVIERAERPNTEQDSVLRFEPGYDPAVVDPGYQGFYAPGELWGTDVADAHGPNEPGAHGYRTVEWKDKEGQVVGRQVEAGRVRVGDTLRSRWLRTAYAYDDFNRLRYVVQPEGTRRLLPVGNAPAALPAGAAPFLFHYRYDGQGRQIAKQVPGTDGETVVVFDQLDRPVLSQDANQRARREWAWTKYDALGRIVLSGLVVRGDTAGPVTLQAQAATYATAEAQYEQRTADGTTYPYFYTTDQAYPRLGQGGFGPGLVLSVTHYDDYNFDHDAAGTADAQYNTSTDAQFPSGAAPVADALRTTGLTTRTQTRVLGVDPGDQTQAAWLVATTFYDERARPVQVQTTHARKGLDLLTTQLDFTGQVVQSVAVHEGPSHTPVTVAEFFAYDHAGRLLTTRQQLPGEAQPVQIARVSYNELGQATQKTMGTGRLAQQVDYAYNVRGWLTQLNDPHQPAAGDLFHLSLHYDRGFTAGYEQYTGNLTGQTWRGRDGVHRAYGYGYDPLSRLLQGDFVARAGAAGLANTTGAWTGELDNYRLSFASYDDNGNLLTLRRRGLLAHATRAAAKRFGPVDQLAYAYQGNRLQAVDDQVTGNQLPRPAGYEGAPTSLAGDFQESGMRLGQEYGYDANGNLTQDRNKGISGIAYNHLNLPRRIHFGIGADSIVFRYTAAGQKVAKLVYQTGQPTRRTDYLGPYQYEQDSLRFFPHAEGRVLRFANPTSGAVRYEREFTFKDHLGNLRLAYRLGQRRAYAAGLEPGDAGRETRQFDSLSVSPPVAQPTPLARTGAYAARLHAGGSTPQPLGPLTQFPVQKGDTISVTAPGLYPQATSNHAFAFSLAGFVASLLQPAPAGTPTGADGARRGGLPLLQIGLNAAVLNTLAQLPGGVPKGYLRVLSFTEDSVLVDQRTVQLTTAALGHYEDLSTGPLIVQQDGYVSVYVGNESAADVYFDDVTVEHRPGLQVQENQYDPFGLDLAGVSGAAVGLRLKNFYQFNGKENQLDLGLNWNHQDARFYDYQIGRWHVVDPLMEVGQENWTPYQFGFNNAVRFADANGTSPDCPNCPTKPKDGDIHESHNTYYIAKGGSWSETLPEATVVGTYAAPAINYTSSDQGATSPENRVIAGYSIGYNSSLDKFNSFHANATGFRLEESNTTSVGMWKGALRAIGFEASANGTYGNENNNIAGKIKGNALLAEATANAGLLTGQKNEVGLSAGASVGLYGLRGQLEGSATFMGVKITGGFAPSIGSANATLGADAKYNISTGQATVNATWGASLGTGATFKFGIDLPLGKMVGL